MKILVCFLLHLLGTKAYKSLYTIANFGNDDYVESCKTLIGDRNRNGIDDQRDEIMILRDSKNHDEPTNNQSETVGSLVDPLKLYEAIVDRFLFGNSIDKREAEQMDDLNRNAYIDLDAADESLNHYPSGKIFRSELFANHSGVHLPVTEYTYRGHSRLLVTKDRMQTAVNAFFIFLEGNLRDVMSLPPEYVLKSARTISMMRISREKLAATWKVVRGRRHPREIPFETLERFRPLFKYVTAKDMAQLNFSDHRILSYVGTHPDLNRHQVGVIASHYSKLNQDWQNPKYLNLLNNILCGMPISHMRRIKQNVYLQLNHQVFNHITACDELQRRFFLGIMTTSQALGKSFSWTARDVTRLGLLLAEVKGPDLRSIHPEAMSGITAQVVTAMNVENLLHISDVQMKYIDESARNLLAKKVKLYMRLKNAYKISSATSQMSEAWLLCFLLHFCT